MILIIGASGGIGQFLVDRFIKDGEDVHGTYNKNSNSISGSTEFVKIDITESIEIQNWLKKIENKLDNITVVNCVGINYNCFGHKADTELWQNVINVNLSGTFNVIRAVLPYMREDRYGRIVNLSSVVPQLGVHGASAYAASKSGLVGLTKSIAKENGALGITINNLNLGYFDAGMISSVADSHLDKIVQGIPVKRLGHPLEIYKVIRMIIDVEYINGASLDINGGI